MSIRISHREYFDDLPNCVCGDQNTVAKVEIGSGQVLALCAECMKDFLESVSEYENTSVCEECKHFSYKDREYSEYPYCIKKKSNSVYSYQPSCDQFEPRS